MEHHGYIMIGGFLLSFVIGFLTTAIPRFTETEYLSSLEVAISVGIISTMLWSGIFNLSYIFNLSILIGLVFIATYSIRRFLGRKNNPPDTFIFVGIAIALGLVGISLILSTASPSFGKLLLFQGMVLSLTLGVGGRLVPGILGHVKIVKSQRERYENKGSFFKAVPKANYAIAAIFISSFPIEYFLNQKTGLFLRAIAVSYIAILYWRILKFPAKKTIHAFSIWIACNLIFIGSWFYYFFPTIHAIHLTYIGGFGLLTLMVASRVTLAHGKDPMEKENRKFPLLWVCILLCISAITRSSIFLFPEQYQSHLTYSASLWVIGLVFWGIIFIPRVCKVPKI